MQDKHCKDTFFAVYHYNLLVLHKLSNISYQTTGKNIFVVFLPVLCLIMVSYSTCIFTTIHIIITQYISSAANNTVFTTTTDASTTGFYTLAPTNPTTIPSSAPTLKYPTQRPSSSPTFMPTVNGAFPFIHYLQSDIECGRNIALQDNIASNVYTQFTSFQTISNIKISFIVCKSSSTFHYSDKLRLYEGDDDNSTEWSLTEISQYSPSGYCTIFDPSINILYEQTYFIGLNRNNDYGKYTIYMHCNTNYNQYIEPGQYNDYIIPQFDESKITLIGSISCGITLIHSVTRNEWSFALNQQQYYSFTVTQYTQWIQLSTCDKIDKQHSITLYYISGGDNYSVMPTQIINIDSCFSLEKYYLLPGKYYISIDIKNLLYNDYTLNMQCSNSNYIINVTNYNKYNPATPNPTKGPKYYPPTTTKGPKSNPKTDDISAETIGWYIAIIIIVIGLIIGICLGYRKYKKRKTNIKSNNLDEKIAVPFDNQMEMVERVVSNDTDNNIDVSDESNNESDDKSRSESDIIAAAAAEGGEGEHLMNMEGDGNIINNVNNGNNNDEEMKVDDATAPAAPAFANIDFEAAPPIVEISPEIHYDEIDNTVITDHELNRSSDSDNNEEVNDGISLPDKQYEIGIKSYCYVDNNDNVYGIIVDELQYDYFMIIDFFEKRKRKCHKKSLTLIQNVKDYKNAKRQYYKYKKSVSIKRRKSTNK
eukprot:49175_1